MSDNKTVLRDALSAAISDTIEEMTFQPVDEIIDENSGDTADDIWAILPLIIPVEGEMLIKLPVQYAAEFTRIVYALQDEEEFKDEMVFDLVAELVNTIGGRFMAKIVPPDREFKLGLPKTGMGEHPVLFDEVIRINCRIGEYMLSAAVAGEGYVKFE